MDATVCRCRELCVVCSPCSRPMQDACRLRSCYRRAAAAELMRKRKECVRQATHHYRINCSELQTDEVICVRTLIYAYYSLSYISVDVNDAYRFLLSMKDRWSTLFNALVVLLYIRHQSLGIAANHIYTNLHIYVIDIFEKKNILNK